MAKTSFTDLQRNLKINYLYRAFKVLGDKQQGSQLQFVNSPTVNRKVASQQPTDLTTKVVGVPRVEGLCPPRLKGRSTSVRPFSGRLIQQLKH